MLGGAAGSDGKAKNHRDVQTLATGDARRSTILEIQQMGRATAHSLERV